MLQQWKHDCKRCTFVQAFQTPSAGRWVLQHAAGEMITSDPNWQFQTPSAGRWVQQQFFFGSPTLMAMAVSNPISGEVGAAAYNLVLWEREINSVSNPISGEVGAAALSTRLQRISNLLMFQTPSAGRWVLQPVAVNAATSNPAVSNPISGEVGAAAPGLQEPSSISKATVSNPISGEVGAAVSSRSPTYASTRPSFKPHQRGGGCCSTTPRSNMNATTTKFQTPSAGRWVLQHRPRGGAHPARGRFQTPSAGRWVLQLDTRAAQGFLNWGRFQTPSAGRWVLQPCGDLPALARCHRVSNPISGEVGAAALKSRTRSRTPVGFKPHQRGGGCCS